MAEMLVFVNDSRGQPAWDCQVQVRSSTADPWKQAIEDGHVAVFRRAVFVDSTAHSTLEVSIRHLDQEGVLRFALASSSGTP